ncbi:MAG: addiction module antidote protein, HigA family [Methylococcaceae bacterium]|nr:MAG: addiction module antidote protein, HigA family [Methylococcaceae bacterium]
MFKNGMRPVHPGECLREDYLLPLQMSVAALAKALGLPLTRVEDIVGERCGLTNDTVTRLARYFDTTPQFWMALQAEYDLRVAEIEDEVRWMNRCKSSRLPLKLLY